MKRQPITRAQLEPLLEAARGLGVAVDVRQALERSAIWGKVGGRLIALGFRFQGGVARGYAVSVESRRSFGHRITFKPSRERERRRYVASFDDALDTTVAAHGDVLHVRALLGRRFRQAILEVFRIDRHHSVWVELMRLTARSRDGFPETEQVIRATIQRLIDAASAWESQHGDEGERLREIARTDPVPRVRVAAGRLVMELARAAPEAEAAAVFAEFLTGPDRELTIAAVAYFARVPGPSAVAALSGLVEAGDVDRRLLAQALGRSGSPEAEPALLALLARAAEPEVVEALGAVGTTAALPALVELGRGFFGDRRNKAAALRAVEVIRERSHAEPGRLSLTGPGDAGALSLPGVGAGGLSVPREGGDR